MDIAKLNVKLTASAGAFASTMNGAARQVSSLGRSIGAAGSMVFGFGGALAAMAAGGSMVYLVKQSMDSMDAAAKLSDRLGIATEKLAGLQHAANLSGVSAEQLTGGFEKMMKSLGEAATEGGAAQQAFAKLGLDATALANMTPDAAFAEIAEGLKNIHNPAERATAAMQIFGKSGQSLLPLMLSGKEGIAAAQAEAEKLGLTFSRVDAAKVEAANDAMTRLQAVFVGAAQTLAIELSPFIEAAAVKLTDLGTSGQGMAGFVVNGFELVLTVVAKTADYLALLQAGWHTLRGVAGIAILGIVKYVDLLGSALVKVMNLLPGVEVEWTNAFSNLSNALVTEIDSAFAKAGESFDTFAEGTNAAAVAATFADIRAKAEENAKAIAANAEKMRGAAIDTEDWAEKLKLAEQNAAKVTDTLDGLQKELATFGMNDSEKKLFDLQALDAAPEQIAKAKELLTLRDELTKLQGLDTGDAMTDFAAKMERLQALYAQGRVTADQFQRIRDAAKTSLNEKLAEDAKGITESVRTPLEQYAAELDKLNALMERGLINQETFDRAKLKAKTALDSAQGAQAVAPNIVRAGSAEALRLAFDQTRGVQRLSKDEIPKKALAEAQEHTRTLERIERNTRGGTAGDVQVVEI